MANFKEVLAQTREQLKGLLNDSNIDQIAQANKGLDALEAEYNNAEKQASEAKENLVKYVKEYAFNDKAEDTTHTEEAPTLDELFEKEFNSK